MSEYYLYAVTVACPACKDHSQFVVTTEKEIGLMQDIGVSKSHCPECGVHIQTVGEWDLQDEHRIETVKE
jgi:peptide subunit release factor 1 (eRF1)